MTKREALAAGRGNYLPTGPGVSGLGFSSGTGPGGFRPRRRSGAARLDIVERNSGAAKRSTSFGNSGEPVNILLYVHETGESNAPTILFLHGGATSGRMWQPQLDDLTDYHCLAPDLPEHGQSHQAGPFTLQGAVESIADLIKELSSTGKANLVGLSVGAAIGLELLQAQPDLVDRAILSGTTPRIGSGMKFFSELFYIPMLKLLPRDRLAKVVMKTGGIPPAYHDQFTSDLQYLNADLFRNVNRAMSQVEIPRGEVPPTLVLVGEKELGISKRHARVICQTVAGTTGKFVKGVGHAWNLEAPDLFNQMVRCWLEDQPLPPELQELK